MKLSFDQQQGNRTPRRNKLLAFVLLVITAITVTSILFRQSRPSAPGLTAYPQVRGYALGQTIAREIPGGGKVLVLAFHNFGRYQDAVNKHLLKGLQEGLGGKFTVVEGGVSKNEPVNLEATYDSQRFEQWIQDNPGMVAIVSQVGTPADAVPSRMKSWPPVYCDFIGPSHNWRMLLKAGVVCAVVAEKQNAVLPEQVPLGKTWQELFDSQYQLLLPAATPPASE